MIYFVGEIVGLGKTAVSESGVFLTCIQVAAISFFTTGYALLLMDVVSWSLYLVFVEKAFAYTGVLI